MFGCPPRSLPLGHLRPDSPLDVPEGVFLQVLGNLALRHRVKTGSFAIALESGAQAR